MNPNMSPQQAQLWANLQAFQLDDPQASFPFSARLARENDWNLDYSQRVIEEYKHFVFLAMTAGHPVTPSVDVDQVWHLHLSYTRSYWEGLCGEVLGEPFHHGPTKGGEAEGAKFNNWYSRTQRSYEEIFGYQPPPDIWPPPAARFAPQSRIRQVSDRTHWIIRKPNLGRKRMIALILCPAGATLAFLSTTAFITSTALSDLLISLLYLIIIISVVSILFTVIVNALENTSKFNDSKKDRRRGGGGCGGDGGGGCGGCGGCGG